MGIVATPRLRYQLTRGQREALVCGVGFGVVAPLCQCGAACC